MNCEPLAVTGLDWDLGLILGIAAGCLVAGAMTLLLIRARRRKGGGRGAALAFFLIGGSIFALAPAPPTYAASADCTTAANTLTITQTSAIDGIGPGIAPRPIAGLVVNHGSDSTRIAAVLVEITAVTTASNAPSGVCDSSDFTIFDARMPVDRILAPEGSTPFAGASIGFANKSVDQDVCQGAVISLLYTANPD